MSNHRKDYKKISYDSVGSRDDIFLLDFFSNSEKITVPILHLNMHESISI
jgi:hypothetical protein